MRALFTFPVLVLTIIFSVKSELPWYVGFLFVWGAVDFVSHIYDTVTREIQ